MKHYGDITKLSGYEVPVVDVITGGSPCQDLSVAGKRAGLAGERSGLFMEQMRIVREMREKDGKTGRTGWAVRPRYMVWENVPGAFSSGNPKGADFAAVIEEIIKVAEPGADVCVCVPDRGWTKAGCYYAEDGSWSIAWRVHDAQFWGVPQRRKRIALVADFGGLSAPEILFERKGLSGHPEPGGAQRKGAATDASRGAGTAGSFFERGGKPGGGKGILIRDEGAMPLVCNDAQRVYCLQGNGIDRADTAGCNGRGWREDVSYTINTIDRPAVACANPWDSQSGRVYYGDGAWHSLSANESGGQSRDAYCYDARGNGDGNLCPTLTGDHQNRVTDYTALCIGNGQLNQMSMAEQANTLDTMHDQQAVLCFQNTGQGWWNEGDAGATLRTPCGGDGTKANLVVAVDCRNGTENAEVNGTLQAKSNGGTSLNLNNVCRQAHVVRRLTPLECERLQGYQDNWSKYGTDENGKVYELSDSARYRLQGNSIARPFWTWLLRRIAAQYERPATLGSLFDGQGGFPLCANEAGISPIWASEIEKHAIAVTKYHFPDTERSDT